MLVSKRNRRENLTLARRRKLEVSLNVARETVHRNARAANFIGGMKIISSLFGARARPAKR